MYERSRLWGVIILGTAMSAGASLPPKFDQQPMIATTINGVTYYGHDEASTVVRDPCDPLSYTGKNWMADDFADYETGPVVQVQWWGSYMNRTSLPVNKFLIEFLSDLPAGPGQEFSRPERLLQAEVVTLGIPTPGSGMFGEFLIPGSNPSEPVYEYDAQLKVPFPQQPETVYWLKIVALTDDPGTEWGWHNRDYTIMDPWAAVPPDVVPGEHVDGIIPGEANGTPIWHFQDDAVFGSGIEVVLNPDGTINRVNEDLHNAMPASYIDLKDGPAAIPGTNFEGIGAYSKDLAFRLYTPEPVGLSLLALGSMTLLRKRR